MKGIPVAMRLRLSCRVALLALVAIVTWGAVAGCERTAEEVQPAVTVETQEVSLPLTPAPETPTVAAPATPTPTISTPTPAPTDTPTPVIETPTPTPTPAATPPALPTPARPASTATPAPRGQREAPSEWQLETRSNPEVAALYPLADLYTADEIAYFKEVAFGGDPEGPDLAPGVFERRASTGDGVWKWGDGEIGCYVAGNPTARDLAEVESIISRLDTLIPALRFRLVPLSDARADATLLIIFRGEDDELGSDIVVSDWANVGGLGLYFGNDFVISRALVIINSDQPEEYRRRAIVEEIAQVMGLARDSWWFPDSRFYQGISARYGLADIDEALIRLLYDPRIEPGMTIEDLERMGL